MDFTKIYQKYKGLWIALSSDERRVVGKGKTVNVAVRLAQKSGVRTPFLFKVPMKIIPCAGL
ncbi:hypothetical protein COT65_00225 [Candidatus Shapirobacteria bacterium CG09_land_8_20_14_0_10_47_13]|uniref:Uncharacterized protein n=1 Tax=Candidatus Shapirobacteria bacterium CG09_land_8_20_14_0_10_47_13 TaxID=1974481 RepID=A0A2H0WNI6_9BACT|nr:MAG: hypothetical protein COT65_00225 [Candidatus Shapirobacteria bacterium CG09_land_8_20_14_0_10_47_13]